MDLSEDKALEHFRQKFNEAMKNRWTTSFNWAIHNIDKNNWQWPASRRLQPPTREH